MVAELPRIQIADPAAQRWQNMATIAINGLIRQVVFTVYTSKTRPIASEAQVGAIRVRDEGQAELIQVCMKNADGNYGWVTIATAT